jgi:two-component sensor histidine kinase
MSRALIVTGILGLSILLQLAAAAVAGYNIRRSGASLPWTLVGSAILLMAIRRITTFLQIVTTWEQVPVTHSLLPEIIALLISVLMLTGLMRLGPLFAVMQRLVEEKDLLLHESLHSTKNNLQSLLSLISVQESFAEGRREQELAQEMQRRVRVFAMLQEELFRSHSSVDFREFMEALVSSIRQGMQSEGTAHPSRTNPPRTKVEVEIRDIPAGQKELLYCGLVVNEALTNAFKYAVPNTPEPRIRIESGIQGQEAPQHAENPGALHGRRYLRIRDNGPGIPEHLLRTAAPTFGLTFLKSLSGGDGWKLDIENDGGAVVTFRF